MHDRELAVGASIGICVYPSQGSTAQELITKADAAMYRAKTLGRSRAMAEPSDGGLLEKLDEYYALLEKVLRGTIKSAPERTAEYVRLAQVLRERADVAHLIRYHNVLLTIDAGI